MKKILYLLIPLLFISCINVGSGIRTLTGSALNNVPANLKIALFSRDDRNTFIHDDYDNDEKDIVFRTEDGQEAGAFTPVRMATINPDNSYSILFPEDPSTVKCLIAWNDLDNDDEFDLGTEAAYLPVKTIDSVDFTVHSFSYIEEAAVITYLAIYSTMDRDSFRYDLDNYPPLDDNFDALGAEGYNFNFR